MKPKAPLPCMLRLAGAAVLILSLTACSILVREPVDTREKALQRLRPSRQPDFVDARRYRGLEESIQHSLVFLQGLPENQRFYFGKDQYDTAHMIRGLSLFLSKIRTNPSAAELNRFIADHYIIYQSAGADRQRNVLFTGYYEPLIAGCREKTPHCTLPVYARPTDLITIDLSLFAERFKGERITGRYTGRAVVPYYTRQEIDASAVMKERAPVLAWVADPVALFFLQVQGSGKIQFDDGRSINVHYHATNGHPYRSIGRLLIAENKISRADMSMQAIRRYLADNPEERNRILHYNPRYVFFKREDAGPLGCLQVPLTPMRSIALDRRLFPAAALAYIETRRPEVDDARHIVNWPSFSTFVLNQDTGGAIKGPGRADLFWGSGPYAETAAGHMQHDGRLYFLVKKPPP